MNQREAKRMVLREVAGIVADLHGNPSMSVEDELRWNLAVGDLYVELRRRAGDDVIVEQIEGQLCIEVPT